MLPLLLAAVVAWSQAEEPRAGTLPLQVPQGWTGKREEAAFVLSPKDLAAGKLYTVVSADLTAKVGSMKGLLEAGQASLSESGKFKALREPIAGKGDGGWDYEVVIGSLEKDGSTLLVQVVAFRKGEAEGLVMVVSDSVDTLTRYSDAFTALVRGVGAPKAAPALPPPAAASKVDLRYTLPAGWVSKELDAGTLIAREKDDADEKYSYRLMILPSEPLEGSLRQKFLQLWASQIQPGIETKIVPLPLVRRLKSGAVIAFDQDPSAKVNGVTHHGGMYLLAKGKRCVPILCFYFGLGNTKALHAALDPFLESAEIPGAGDGKIALLDPADLAGVWSTSSYSMANYVTAGGQYAGDASVATADYLTLNKDGTFSQTLMAVTATKRIKEKSEGTWTLEDSRLILASKEAQPKTYRVFGAGSDPKGGAFLVLSTYSNTDEEADLCIPRRLFSGTWFKRKE